MQAKGGGFAGDWARGGREGLVAALRASHPGLELIDADLDLGESRRADLVGVDPAGRLVLVLMVEGAGDAPILGALDGVAFCVRNRGLLGAHFESTRVDPELPPQVLLVAERFEEHLLARMLGLSGDSVRCLEVRRVTSRRGERVYLVPPVLPGPTPGAPDGSATRALLRALSPEAASLAEDLLRRLDRVDSDLGRQADGSGVAIAFQGEPLCSLRAVHGVLQGRVGPHGPLLPLPTRSDAAQYLEEVMARFRHLLAQDSLSALTPRDEGLRPGAGGGEDDPILRALDPGAPILTQDEIAAFQQP